MATGARIEALVDWRARPPLVHNDRVTETPESNPPGDPVAVLAHELRAPLNALIGYADAMREEAFGPLEPGYRERAGHILTAGRHLLALVDSLSAPGPGEPCDPAELAGDTLHLFTPRAEAADVDIALSVEKDVGEIRVDSLAFGQVLYTLLDNALKFTPAGGNVAVRLEQAGAELSLTVENGGGSGPPADGAGQGLGLSIARTVLARIGGSLALEPRPDGGYRAHARLPAMPEDPDEAP